MILSDKCREDFLKEYGGQEWEFNEKYEMMLVIEFLDSKTYKGYMFFSYVFGKYLQERIASMTHIDLCAQTIQRCNDFYNSCFIGNP